MRKISIYITCLIGLMFPVSSYSQVDTLDIIEIEISSSRAGDEVSKSARTVQVITRDEIDQLPVQSVEEVLELSLGVDIRTRGNGAQADISTRGGSFEQTMILLNGIPMTDPQTGHHTFNIPVVLDDVSRIEVYQGGSSNIFGPKAFSGAINIITQPKINDQLSVRTSAGDHGQINTAASGSVTRGRFTFHGSGSLNNHNGYIKNTDLKSHVANAGVRYRYGKISADIFGGTMQRAFGAQNFYSANFPSQFEKIRTRLLSGSFRYETEQIGISFSGYYRRLNDHFELFREDNGVYQYMNGMFISVTDTAPSWYTQHNNHRTDVFGSMLKISYKTGVHTVTIGGDFRNEDIVSNVLGEPLDSRESVKNYSNAFYTRGTDRTETSLFLEEKISLPKWTIRGGLQFTFHSDYDERISPGLDIGYHITDDVTFFGNAGTSFRFPTFTDLYYNLGGAVGSIDLKPETAINYEVGVRAVHGDLTSQVSFFRRDAENLIDWIRYEGSGITQAANITEVTYTGMDFSVGYLIPNKKEKFTRILYAGINYSFIDTDTSSTGFESNYVLDHLKHKASATVTVRFGENIHLNTSVIYQERKGGYIEPGMPDETPYGDNFLVDAKLSFEKPDYSIFVSCTNLFNEEYVDIGNVEQPGAWIRAGVRVSLQ